MDCGLSDGLGHTKLYQLTVVSLSRNKRTD